jgi:hypothetical protein
VIERMLRLELSAPTDDHVRKPTVNFLRLEILLPHGAQKGLSFGQALGMTFLAGAFGPRVKGIPSIGPSP